MAFRAELLYTAKDMKRFDRVYKKLRFKSLFPILRVLLVLLLLALAAAFVLLKLVWQSWNARLTRYYLILLVMLALWLALNIYRHSATSKALNRKGPAVLTADETLIRVMAEDIRSEYEYGSFTDIAHEEGAYYLYIDKNRAVIIPERCFTEGDPAAFGAFIEQKTGLKLKEIK